MIVRFHSWIALALGGLAACAGTGDAPETGDTQEAASTCRSPRPTPPPCHNVQCVSGTWTFTNATAGTACGSGGHCNSSGMCINPSPPPPPPAPGRVHFADRHPTSLTVAWDPSAGTSSYQIVMNGIIQGTTTATTVTLGGLNPSTQYCVTVTADGPGGASSAAPICNYTGFYVPLIFGGELLDRVPWTGQSPQMAARVERVELAPQSLGGAGFTLVRPNGHESDCTAGNPDLAISLLPGQAAQPTQLANMLGEANPPLGQYGFGFGAGGLWFGGCTQAAVDVTQTIWLEVNFTPASAIHIVSATYGANVGASGNLTSGAAFICNGEVFCSSTVANFTNFEPISDPAPGQAKDFVATFTCGSDPTVRSTSIPAEAIDATAVLECP